MSTVTFNHRNTACGCLLFPHSGPLCFRRAQWMQNIGSTSTPRMPSCGLVSQIIDATLVLFTRFLNFDACYHESLLRRAIFSLLIIIDVSGTSQHIPPKTPGLDCIETFVWLMTLERRLRISACFAILALVLKAWEIRLRSLNHWPLRIPTQTTLFENGLHRDALLELKRQKHTAYLKMSSPNGRMAADRLDAELSPSRKS